MPNLMVRSAVCLLVMSAAWSAGAQQTIDITPEVIQLMKCTSEAYERERDPSVGFDERAHDLAWASCQGAREAILDKLPLSARGEWEAKLETIHRSVADSMAPKDTGLPGYGLNAKEPVMVGGISDGARRTQAYFSRLRSPSGDPVSVRRIGSCCRFETPHASVGDHAVLDKYEVTYPGLAKPIVVYVNIYDEGPIKSVEGFTLDDGQY